MEQYYDLVMANAIAEYAKKETGMEMPGTGYSHLPDLERWEKIKEELSGSTYGVITEWGLIDFDPAEQKKVRKGEGLSYSEYLDLQFRSAGNQRKTFQKVYYDCYVGEYKGCIEKIRKKKNLICFQHIYVRGWYRGGDDSFEGKEDHVWMELSGFEQYKVGDCIAFDADVYRYVKTGQGKMMDFGLFDPQRIRKIPEYKLPSDEEIRLQTIDEIICNDICMLHDQCYGYCIANEEWLENMRKLLLGDN